MATRVLVVDDEEDFRVIIKDVLEGAGYEVLLAEDGQEGLESAHERRPDVVLVDWMMPRLDGRAFVHSLRRTPELRSVPVMMLTVKQAAEDETQALGFGVDEFIIKPFRAEDLLARLRALLRRAKA